MIIHTYYKANTVGYQHIKFYYHKLYVTYIEINYYQHAPVNLVTISAYVNMLEQIYAN